MPKPMTENERVEAACRAAIDTDPTMNGYHNIHLNAKRNSVLAIVCAAYPELSGPEPTHVIVPREPPSEFFERASDEFHRAKYRDGLAEIVALVMALRAALQSQETKD